MVRPRNVLMAWDSSLCSSEASNALKLCQGDLEAAKRYLSEEKIKQAAANRERDVLMAWDSSLCSSEASNALQLCQGDLEAAKRYLTEEKIKQAAADRERDEERKRAVIVADREAAAKAAEIQKRNSRSFSEFQHYIKDEDLIGKIISFCDFRETVVIGMTNTRFKKISDNCLDHAADHALTLGGSDESNENELLEVHGAGHDMMYDVRTLRKNEWTYGTRAALVQVGIDTCGEKEDLCDAGDLEIEAENFDFNEGRARYLFNTRGNVDVKDFLTDDHDEEMAAARGWNVCITPMTTEQNISRREAAMEIMLQKHYNLYIKEPGYYDFSCDDEDDEVDHDERVLCYYSLCLLRKADPLSIQHGFVAVRIRRHDYPKSDYRSSVMFKLRSSSSSSLATNNRNNNNGTRIELHSWKHDVIDDG